MNSKKNPNSVSTTYLDLFVENGILYCIYKDIELVDLGIAKICVKDRLEFSAYKAYPILFDITRIKQSTKEARDYLANEGNDLVTASAILISSPMLKMAANFYIMVNKPKNPSRMFTDRESALEWLSQFQI
ncbi:hypothetical protein [uncultured Pontibacter sp.]|uniref:DUF7793 family protein n=1 Tax=uncultured Pontibacter sp. TaxID=453356 RepID=UPI002635AB11|nr:hypothetical protein [uncultured Pontibacter sp.]